MDHDKPNFLSRRRFLIDTAMGLGGLALGTFFQRDGIAGNTNISQSSGIIDPRHIIPKCKRVIFLYMAYMAKMAYFGQFLKEKIFSCYPPPLFGP